MTFNKKSYSTLQYEVPAIADSATTMPPGTGVKITKFPVDPVTKTEDNYYNVAAAGAGDEVHAVVNARDGVTITDKIMGRIVMLNAGLIPVLLSADLKKNDHLKPTTSGKWDKAMAGDKAFAKLVDDGTKDGLAWARPVEVKI